MGLNIGKFTSFLLFTLVNLIGNRGGPLYCFPQSQILLTAQQYHLFEIFFCGGKLF